MTIGTKNRLDSATFDDFSNDYKGVLWLHSFDTLCKFGCERKKTVLG